MAIDKERAMFPSTAPVIRPATSGDSVGIRDVIQSGFDESFLSMTPYGCDGISAYIEELISFGDMGFDTTFVVATCGDRTVGVIELRLFPHTILVNYICILPDVQASGLGKSLLNASLQRVPRPEHHTVALDVLTTNQRALDWYQRLGFATTSKTNWWTITNQRTSLAGSAFVSGYPQAQASHEKFGFSQFSLQTRRGRYSVGRLNFKWFRLTDPEMLADTAAMARIALMDPNRGTLILAPDTLPMDLRKYHGIQTVSTLRLEASLGHVMSQLRMDSGETR